MRYLLFLIGFGILSALLAAEAESDNLLLFYTTDELRMQPSPPHPEFIRFFLTAKQAGVKPTWRAGEEAFPRDLTMLVRNAAVECYPQSPDENFSVSLQLVRIRPILPSSLLLPASGMRKEDFKDSWFVACTYSLEPVGNYKCIVALLDGSYAIRQEGPEVRGLTETKRQAAMIGSKVEMPGDREGTPFYEILKSAAFPLPERQWKPFRAPFPVDINAESINAKRLISEKWPSTGELSLKEILIQRFMPDAAVTAANQRIIDHFDHWIVIYTFSEDLETVGPAYRVVFTLDRKALAVTRIGSYF